METEPIPIFLKISVFAYIIPGIVGIVYWKALTKPLKIYWFWHVVAIFSTILIWIYDFQYETRIILERALVDVGMTMVTGWFCIELFQKKSEKLVIGVCYAVLISCNLYDWLQYGSRLHSNPILAASFVLITFTTFILLKILVSQENNRFQKPIFVALLALFIESFLGVLFYGSSDFLARYLTNRWYAVFWYEISPISNLIYVSMATYALYLGGQTRRNLGKIPELEADEEAGRETATADLKRKNH